MLLALVSLVHAAPLAACGQTWGAGGLTDVVQSADLSMSKMDKDGYLAARDLLLVRLGCVNEPLSGSEAGAVHRVVATAAFLEKDEGRIAPALGGLLAADPGHQLSYTLYPEGHKIRGLLSHGGLLARDPASRALVTLESGLFEVDGLPLQAAPVARAAIIQRKDGQGEVVETRYVWPGEDLGEWAAPVGVPAPKRAAEVSSKAGRAARPLPAAPQAGGPRSPGKARVPLLAATAASAVGTGVLLGLAVHQEQTFFDLDSGLEEDELRALRKSTNELTIAWSAAGVATLGLGVGLVFAW